MVGALLRKPLITAQQAGAYRKQAWQLLQLLGITVTSVRGGGGAAFLTPPGSRKVVLVSGTRSNEPNQVSSTECFTYYNKLAQVSVKGELQFP